MRKLIILLVLIAAPLLASETNKVDLIAEQTKDIRWESRNYVIKNINDLEKVAQSPEKTLKTKEGNCVDTAVLIKELAEEKGLKAEYKLERKGKHVVVLVTEGVKITKFSNGRKRF